MTTNATNSMAASWSATQQALFASLFPEPRSSGDDARPEDSAPIAAIQRQFEGLQATWKESLEKWTALAQGHGDAAKPDAEAIKAMFMPAWWRGPTPGSLETSLQTALEGPRYAVLWDLDQKLARLQHLTLRRDRAAMAYQAVMQRAWNGALATFSRSFANQSLTEQPSWRSLADRWLQTANEVMIETYRTEEFVEVQRQLMRAASDLRLTEREIVEDWCAAFHIPTRSEMDETQRTVTELRRRVRLLERAGRSTKQVRVPASPAPKPSKKTRATRRAARQS